MSDGRLALLALALLPAVATAAPPGAPEASQLLARADRVRTAWTEAVLTIRVTTQSPGSPERTGRFEIWAKGPDRAHVRFLEAGDEGKALVMKGDDAWLLLPTASNPIKVPKSHRLAGGFSVADVARIRFEEDYDAVVEREETLDGRPCAVLRLAARAGRRASYPVARVWVDRKEGLYRKAVFLLASGKTAREVSFDSYRPFGGVLSVERMTVVDAIRAGKTQVEYLSYEKRSVPDRLFDPATARAAPAGAP